MGNIWLNMFLSFLLLASKKRKYKASEKFSYLHFRKNFSGQDRHEFNSKKMVDLRCENLFCVVFMYYVMPEIHTVLWKEATEAHS